MEGSDMPEEFEGDLQEAVFWGADLTGATFRDVNLTDVRISHAWLVNVDIDALVDRVVINGVDVSDYVNEHDPWWPVRSMLRATTPEEMQGTWGALASQWATTLDLARSLPEAAAHESVDGEWSLVQTLRHLVFATDKWFTTPVLGGPFHPMGMPNSGSVDFPWPGLEPEADPTLAEVLAVRAERSERVRRYLGSIGPADLEQEVDVLENGPHPIRECIHTVFEEEFWHNRYARRDLDRLRRTTDPPGAPPLG